MKKYLIVVILFIQIINVQGQGSWIKINNDSPVYSYSYPGAPTITDTMNIKHSFYEIDTTLNLQVLQIQSAELDSSNTEFTNALQQANGDTLRALVNIFLQADSVQLTASQDINISSEYKGLEVSLKYDEPDKGRIVVSFARFFYNQNILITFTIVGFEDDSRLTSDRDLFFNSISFIPN
jgi:hypothetical protein